nr:UDP-N-acetylmuramate--alanine ligase [uncultured bacterium]
MKFHFIGIGGIGMSGLAHILLRQHHHVSGSDAVESVTTKNLEELGATITIGHNVSAVNSDCDYIVISSAILDDNVELQKAKMLGFPILKRHQMLGEIIRGYKTIAVSGSHGKTTTTAMMGALLTEAQYDPLIINGGIVNAFGSNVSLGLGSWCVVEGDESDGSFLNMQPIISVITNIDLEHMEFFKTQESLEKAFQTFIENTSILGCTLACIDDPLAAVVIKKTPHHTIITYGESENSDIRLTALDKGITGSYFSVKTRRKEYKNLFLPMMGKHNVLNSLAIVGAGEFLDLDEDTIRETLKNFQGVQRRFTIRGTVNSAVFVDDYAHHPREIETVIKSAKQYGATKIVAIVEPHRYSRVKDLLHEYAPVLDIADDIILIPLYGAFEEPIEGVSSFAIAQQLSKPYCLVETFEDLIEQIKTRLDPGTIFLFMGAGKISNWCKLAVTTFGKA